MNRTETADLVTRIKQTWNGGPPGDAWEATIQDLDAGACGTTYVRLARTWVLDDHRGRGPDIADFMQMYRSINTNDASTRPIRSDCTTCQNSGWSPVLGEVTCADGTVIEMDQGVEPCRCAWGRDREAPHRAILDWNEAELERISPGRTARKADEKRDAA